jgi:site-specific recombinase XerD
MKQEHEKLFEQYLAEETLIGRTIQGFKSTRQGVKKVIEELEGFTESLLCVRLSDASELQARLLESGLSRTSVLFLLYSASSLYGFLKRKHLVSSNPFSDMKKVRREKKLPRTLLKESEMDRLLSELADFNSPVKLVDRAKLYRVHVACELMYATGMRAAEVSAMKAEDVDFERKIVNVEQGKGGVKRIAFLSEYATAVLRFYIERMRELALSEQHARSKELLFGVRWNSFSECINSTLRAITARLGFPKVTCHHFRHALGYHLLRAGCSVRYIQDILGHKSIRSTEIYTKVDKEDLKNVIDKFHPRSSFTKPEAEEENPT